MSPKRRRKKKKSSTGKLILVVAIIAIISLGVVAWHDGTIGTTSIADINQGDVDTGTSVTIKGELIISVFNILTVSDGDGHAIAFSWEGTEPPLNSIVVVRGEVSSFIWLDDVTSVEAVWILE